jgi:hypothetical protein
MSTQLTIIIFLQCTLLNCSMYILYIAHDPSNMKGIIVSFCPTYLLNPLSLCTFIYSSFSCTTFHCLSFVPLTVIYLPEGFTGFPGAWCKFLGYYLCTPAALLPTKNKKKLLLLYKFARVKVFRCGTSRPVIPWHRKSINRPILWTDYDYIWHGTYYSHHKIIFKISKSSVISGFCCDVNENYQSTARKIPKQSIFRKSLFIFWWLIAATQTHTHTNMCTPHLNSVERFWLYFSRHTLKWMSDLQDPAFNCWKNV